MDKTYNPQHIEQHWSQIWEQGNYFAPSDTGEPYCIVIPPPNVTGSLHMGHGFQCTLMDVLIRYHRMMGEKTLWQVGTDHAGIATQMVVERQLLATEQTRHELGREAFVKKIWEWKELSGGKITEQLRRLGSAIDWSRERFTLDQGLSAAVTEVFIKLYNEGLIYRNKRLVNWDPTFRTAISDLEVITQEEQGSLWYIRYPFSNGNGHIVVATTRPETLFGDVAVAVHPDDSRYQGLIGKHLQLPLTERSIPIIADESIDPNFGSGCVKITPGHDFNDYATGQRHQLPAISIFTLDARLNHHVPAAYQGLNRSAARQKIINDLQALDLVEKIIDHKLNIPRGDRSGDVIEPLLTDQWFVKMKPLAEPAIDAVKNGSLKLIPDTWNKTYLQWLENIEDWCISRQLWWGHRIPAWYDKEQNIYVGTDEATVRKKYNLSDDQVLTQDEDVLDTWFSSALWPFSSLGWPNKQGDFAQFYPTSVLVTGFDIIFFWVARMVMMGLKFTGQLPFKEVYITGLIRDSDGQKMSKSKGNVLDPIDLIQGISLEELIAKRTSALMQPSMTKKIEQSTRKQFPHGIAAFGTDALRFTYCALASTGRDIRFDLGRLEGYRNFCNKLWNAARYVLMNISTVTAPIYTATELENNFLNYIHTFSISDQWIWSRLQKTILEVTNHLHHYRFDLASQNLYEFIWNEYCDWYLEFSKATLNSTIHSTLIQHPTRSTLIQVLDHILRLLHPFMPYITEEIWQRVQVPIGKKHSSIILETYPKVNKALFSSEAEAEIDWLKKLILSTRNIRGEMNIPPNRSLKLLVRQSKAIDRQRLINNEIYLSSLAKIESISWLDKSTEELTSNVACILIGEMELLIPLTGLIDKTAEVDRLTKEINKLKQEYERCENKLNNQQFILNANTEIVIKERTKLAETKQSLAYFEQQLAKIQTIP